VTAAPESDGSGLALAAEAAAEAVTTGADGTVTAVGAAFVDGPAVDADPPAVAHAVTVNASIAGIPAAQIAFITILTPVSVPATAIRRTMGTKGR
jgi:hypothetical protein